LLISNGWLNSSTTKLAGSGFLSAFTTDPGRACPDSDNPPAEAAMRQANKTKTEYKPPNA
jgi:hypothetical protein